MANTPMLNLPVAASVDGSEYAWIVQGGVDKRATLQQISNTAQGFVPTSRSITAGVGLSGGGQLSSDVTLSFDSAELASALSMAITDSFVINSGLTSLKVTFPLAMQAVAGLSASPALNLASDKLLVIRAADGLAYYTTPSAIGTAAGNVPAGGTTGQFLVKASNTNYDTAWSSTISGFATTALDNLASVAINTSLLPGTTSTIDLGSASKLWNTVYANVFTTNNGVNNWTISGVTTLLFQQNGASGFRATTSALSPNVSDGLSLGTTSLMWSDFFLASGAVINFNNGNFTIIHSTGALTFNGELYLDNGNADGAGINFVATGHNTWSVDNNNARLRFFVGATEYWAMTTSAIRPSTNDAMALGTSSLMWSDLFLASGGVINWNNGTLALTQSSTTLTLNPGILTIGSTTLGPPTNTGALRLVDGGDFATNTGLEFQGVASNPGYGWKVVAPDRLAGNTPLAFGYRSASATWTEYARFRVDVAFIETIGIGLRPSVNDAAALGSATLSWSDLFLASGAVINFNNGNVTITHSSGALVASGTFQATAVSTVQAPAATATYFNISQATIGQWTMGMAASSDTLIWSSDGAPGVGTAKLRLSFAGALTPGVNDATALGTTSLMWSDLFLASGGVINFNNGNYTVTHSSGNLAFSSGASFGGDITLNNGISDGAALIFASQGNTSWNIDNNGGLLRFFQGSEYWGMTTTAIRPSTNDLMSLGTASLSWADLFLASGGVINFNNGNATLTHSAGLITSNRPWAFGVAGSIVGTLQLFNATSGSITLTPTTGALGTITLTLPAISGTVVQTAGNQTFTGGFSVTPANIGSFTSTNGATVTPANGNYQYVTLSGTFTFTLTAPASDCAVDILVILGASGSGVTFAFSGFKTAGTGASGSTFTAANSTWYVLSVRRVNSVSTYSWSGPWT